MAPLLPVTLLGDNLGQRHRHLNCLVRKAKESGVSFMDVEAYTEESTIDRLFKIDLAVEIKHVDYILRNLKDDDMLYVSRALKATWLIDHHDIINPKYLEEVLFPEMISPAVTKTKHWLYINLRDPATCQEFYQHHKGNTFEFALKFLSQCSLEFILVEAPKILAKLSPHSLKVLCEKCPRVGKIYFDSLATDEDVKTRYLKQEKSYYNSVKCVLKSDADVFLDITEKYFNMNSFRRFSPLATNYILRFHKTRFTNKLELYVAYILHIPTLAARLSDEECREVVLKLARASFLKQWFQYKVVEPLIKRLSPDKRAAFKKLVFVEKDVGDHEDEWPYEIPAPPTHFDNGLHIFDDQDFMSVISPIYPSQASCMSFGASNIMHAMHEQPEAFDYLNVNIIRVKTDLDRLFDEFRFIGFERALHELGQRLGATSSTDRRRDIFLVLISKTGGRTDAVSSLLRLAIRHSNEPPHTRASMLRSLVKRANVWRLPADVWQRLLDYGHGLGLNGAPPEAACREGLHAVVIRQLLAGECEQAVRDAFMENFSTLSEYSLKVDERVRVANGLQNMLADATKAVEPEVAAGRLQQLLDVLKIYRVRVEPTSPAVTAVVALASRDASIARPLLERLYNEKIARRELLQLNMEFRRDEAALLNALRHDPSVLKLVGLADMLGGWYCWHTNFREITPDFQNHPVQATNDDSSTAQQMVTDSFTAPPTGIRFDSSPVQPLNADISVAPPMEFPFESSAAQFLIEDDSIAPPTSFGFDNSTSELSVESHVALTEPKVIGFGSTAAQSTRFASSAARATTDGSSENQPVVSGITTSQSTDYGSTTAEPTAFGNSVARSYPFRPKRRRGYGGRQTNFDRFISKLVIYFDQTQDLTTRLHAALKERIAKKQNVKLVRPLASLFRKEFEKELSNFELAGKESMKFAAALRACVHRARPVINLAEWGWRKAGVKAVATQAMRCRTIERAAMTRALAADRRTVKVALALSIYVRSEVGLLLDTFASAAKLRPAVALRAAMQYFRHHGVNSDLRVWEIVKPLFSNVDLKPRVRLCRLLGNTECIPSIIKPDFCITLYLAVYKISSYHTQIVLRELSKILPDCDESMESILHQMLDDDAAKDILNPTLFVRYLLLSRNEEDVERRFVTIGNKFLDYLYTLRSENDYLFQRRLKPTLESLKYNSAFLDMKFPSCLSVIERILAWLQKFKPKEYYFKKNTQVHLTILYFKAVRQSMVQMPDVFADSKRKKCEGVEAVGFLFGRNIANDVVKLVSLYFDSIIELYTDALLRYLHNILMYGNSRNRFIGFVLKGILKEAIGIQRRMVVYILREHQICLEDSVKKEIEELIIKDKTIEIFAHAESFQFERVVPYRNNCW